MSSKISSQVRLVVLLSGICSIGLSAKDRLQVVRILQSVTTETVFPSESAGALSLSSYSLRSQRATRTVFRILRVEATLFELIVLDETYLVLHGIEQ